jgi:CheY-like chemotaxis protein
MKRILVVDDDEHLRQVLADILGQDGYVVDCAQDGADALVRLEEHRYALILSDLTMPGLDGPALYEALRTRHHFPTRLPTTLPRVVFMTGHAPGHAAFLRGTTEPILEKPFNLKVVRKVVRVLLEGQPGAAPGPEEERALGERLDSRPRLAPSPARAENVDAC